VKLGGLLVQQKQRSIKKIVKRSTKKPLISFEKQINDMSKQEIKELLLINTYKLALVRSQLEAVSSILIKKKLASYEDIWKKTQEAFEDSTL